MTKNGKGRTGWHQATPRTSKSTPNLTGLIAQGKGIIGAQPLQEWQSVALTQRLTHKGEPHDE